MEDLLTVIRCIITLPILLLESILKGLTFIILIISLIVIAILFPLFRSTWRHIGDSYIFKYATKWKANYPLTIKVFSLWQ